LFSPGPGTYKARFDMELATSNVGSKFGTSSREDTEKLRMRVSNFPPPDSYTPRYKSVKENRASWSFGSGKRSNLTGLGLKTPAPGTYNVEKKDTEGPKYAIAGKLEATSYIGWEQRKTRGNPGPGTYKGDYRKLIKSNGIFSMRAKPKILYETEVPGPGAYKTNIESAIKS